MSLKKDIISAEVQIGSNEAQASLIKLAQETASLTNENDRLRISQAKLKALGKESQNEYKQLTAKIKENNSTIKENKSQMDALRKTIGLTEMSTKQLRARAADLRRELSQMNKSANPAQWNKLNRELIQTERQYKKVQGQIGQTRGILTKLNKVAGGFLPAFGFATILLGIKALITRSDQAFIKLQENVGNLSAITGLVGKDLEWLTQKAKDLSTEARIDGIVITQSADEIVDAFTKMGSARPELLKDKEALAEVTEAALILAAASKIDLQAAISAVASVMNQFNLDASQTTRAINAIAAGSLEGSAEVDSLTESMKNVGTVAADSNMDLEQTVAALEVLAEKQLLGAEAGTKLRGALLKMKAAGVGYASGQFNLRDALIEVNAQLEKQGSDLERDALKQKIFGTENITAGNILLQNVEKYDQLTEAVTGTNVAMEQAATNTDNEIAKRAQAMNKLRNVLTDIGKEASPVITKLISLFADLITKITKLTKESSIISAVFTTIFTVIRENFVGLWTMIKYTGLLLKDIFTLDFKSVKVHLVEAWDTIKTEGVESAKKIANAWTDAYNTTFNEKVEPVNQEVNVNKTSNIKTNVNPIAQNIGLTEEQIKQELDKIDATYAQKQAIIKKSHLEGKISEDQYNADLLQAELDYLASKIKIYKVGSKEYEQAINDALGKQVAVDKTIKDLILKAETELANAKVQNLQDGLQKQEAIENQRWTNEKTALEKRLINKKVLSDQEIALNSTINALIEEGEATHQKKMNDLKGGSNIGDLQNAVDAATPVDPNFATLDQQQQFFDARNALIEAQYQREKTLAGDNHTALVAAELNYNQKIREAKIALIDAEFAQKEKRIEMAQSFVDQLYEIVDQESALGKALFLFKKGLAIAEIWTNVAKAKAEALVFAAPTAGQPWRAIFTAMGIAQTAMIASQTVANFTKPGKKAGGFTDQYSSDDKVVDYVHANEFVANANAVRNPTVKPILDIIDLAQKTGLIGTLNLPAVLGAIGRRSGGYESSSSSSSISNSTVNTSMPVVYQKDPELLNAINKLNSNIEKGIKAKLVYREFEEFKDKVDTTRNNATL